MRPRHASLGRSTRHARYGTEAPALERRSRYETQNGSCCCCCCRKALTDAKKLVRGDAGPASVFESGLTLEAEMQRLARAIERGEPKASGQALYELGVIYLVRSQTTVIPLAGWYHSTLRERACDGCGRRATPTSECRRTCPRRWSCSRRGQQSTATPERSTTWRSPTQRVSRLILPSTSSLRTHASPLAIRAAGAGGHAG
jgi:hypothetical protein